jgi:hypothetical protein
VRLSRAVGFTCVLCIWACVSAAPTFALGGQAPTITATLGSQLVAGPAYFKLGVHRGKPRFSGDIDRGGVGQSLPGSAGEGLGGGAVPALETKSGGGQWTCDGSYDTASNEASGVATGNCTGGSILNRTRYSVKNAQGIEFSGGYISGTYNGCGWLETPKIKFKDGTNETGCSSPNQGYGNIGAIYNSSEYDDGTGVTVSTTTCSAYANFRPWTESSWAPENKLSSALPEGTELKWRYIAGKAATEGYEEADGDFWVMVRDTETSNDGGVNWIFVPYYGCFGSNPDLPAGPGGYWRP